MNPCSHPAIDDTFGDWRGVARLCDECLIKLHVLAVGPVPHLVSGRSRPLARVDQDLLIAQIIGCLDPDVDEARRVADAARVVAECDDQTVAVEDAVARWVWGQPTGLAAVDDLLVRHRADVDAMLGAFDRVVERVDSDD